jgi:hypothetical protein
LVGELGFFEEILDLSRIVEVTLPTNLLDCTDLPGTRRSLDVLEVNFRIFAEVHHRTKSIIEACLK